MIDLKKHYSTIVKTGALLVCPVSGISHALPDFSSLGKIYFDSRHPLGVRENYPDIYNKYDLFPRLSNFELAGIILATFQFYGKLKSELHIFKQNELLATKATTLELLAFIDFLRTEFIFAKVESSSFSVSENFNSLYLFSYQQTFYNIKNSIGFDTLTVQEAIERKQVLVGGRDTIKAMTADIKQIFKQEIEPFISEESAARALAMIGPALLAPTDSEVTKITDALTKRLGEGAAPFNKEFWRYRAYFERRHLTKEEDKLDLSFDSQPVVSVISPTNESKENEQSILEEYHQQQNRPSAECGDSKTESLAERLARLRSTLGSR